MNRNFYRVIFNQARGLLMVVGDIVRKHQSVGRSSQQAKTSVVKAHPISATLKPISFLTLVALGFVSVVSQSEASTIVVDNNADRSQQASIVNGNIVNIQEANAAGVSHNKYTQFDVSGNGVILNNSAQQSTSQLAGNIAGNSNLAQSGSAKVILNEVNSPYASQLNGKIEVAGQKAQVVIANAAGITCNGCGFINADRATLTTGELIIENGELKGYQVEQGSITINGELNSQEQDYTDLIARTVSVNNKIQANQLTVITGRNKVSRDLTSVDALAGTDIKPEVAIDVSALGGMYAGKIKLVSTEKGVGVHNLGLIGVEDNTTNIDISANGVINNMYKNSNVYGSIGNNYDHAELSNQDVTIRSSDDIISIGRISGKNILIDSGKSVDLALAGFHAGNDVIINAGADVTMGYYPVINGDFTINAGGKITTGRWLTVKKNIIFNGKQGIDLVAVGLEGDNVSLLSDGIINIDSLFGKHGVTIQGTEINNTGVINLSGGGSLSVTTVGKFTNTGGIHVYYDQEREESLDMPQHSSAGIYINAAQGIENSWTFVADDITLVSGQAVNNTGKMTANNNLNINAESIYNTNQLVSASDLALIANSKITNTGTINAANDLSLAATLGIDNKGEMHGRNVNLTTYKTLSNQGSIYAENDLTVQANEVNNASQIDASGDLMLTTDGKIINTGTLHSAQDLTLNGAQGVNNKGTVAGYNVNVISDKIINNQGSIEAENELALQAASLTNAKQLIASGDVTVTTDGKIVNTGSISSEQDITLNGAQGVNNNKGTVTGYNVNVISDKIINNQGSIQAENELALQAASVTNAKQLIASGDLTVTTDGKIVNTGSINSDMDIMLNGAQGINNNKGSIAGYNVNLTSEQVINNQGSITAENDMMLRAHDVYNTSQVEAAGELTLISADKTVNSGTLNASGAINLATNTLNNNANGAITSDSDITIGRELDDNGEIAGNAKTVDNHSATIVAQGNLTINADKINSDQALTL